MKKPIWFSRAIAIILSTVIISSIFIPAVAEKAPVRLLISSVTYSSERNTYVAANEVLCGDTMFLKVTATQIDNLGGLSFVITYNTKAFSFSESKSVCLIKENSNQINYYVNSSKEYLQVTYDNTSYNTQSTVSGAIFYLAFSVLESQDTTDNSFVLTVKDLYDNTLKQNDIAVTADDSCNVMVVAETISQDALNTFKALENITYPGSKDAIDSARSLYQSLSDKQKSILSTKYPEYYGWLSTAYTRYNRLAEQAGQKIITDEVDKFRKDYAAALSKNTESITLNDKSLIEAAAVAYGNCSAQAKTYLQKENKLLSGLTDRLKQLSDCKEEVDGFLTDENYSVVWNKKILDNRFDINYMQYTKFIELALVCYDMLSDEAKAAVAPEYSWLCKLKDEANKYLALDDYTAKLAEKVSNFQQTYLHVFTLNENNVAVEDTIKWVTLQHL